MCGIKECAVLVFSSSGTVADRIQLTPPLDAANLIIKVYWLHFINIYTHMYYYRIIIGVKSIEMDSRSQSVY